ncbi:MAG: hypothetical protein ACI4AK_01015 [Lepagella sp.]
MNITLLSKIFLAASKHTAEAAGHSASSHEMASVDEIFSLAAGSSFIGISVVAVVLFLLIVLNHRWKRIFNWLERRNLFVIFVITWFVGLVTYDVGMYTGDPGSLWGNFPMAIIHSFEIFLLESDAAALHPPFHNNWVFMTIFSLVHFSAAIVTLLFVIKHFGFSIISAVRRYVVSSRFIRALCNIFTLGAYGKRQYDYFIFWGLNDYTYFLASDIKRHYEQHPELRRFRIIVIRSAANDKASAQRNGMTRLFNFISIKNQDLDRLLDLDCLTCNTFANLREYKAMADGSNNCDIFASIGLKFIPKILNQKSTGRAHFFFLSDQETDNIYCLKNIIEDRSLVALNSRPYDRKEDTSSDRVICYCHARSRDFSRFLRMGDIPINLIDSSSVSIESLKINPEYQPVRFVDVDTVANPGCVSSKFTSLVVGFNEVGQDATKFLYEFGAFVDSKSDASHTDRSYFRCHVVDNKMKDYKGNFIASAPAMAQSTNALDGSHLVDFHDFDFRSDRFVDLLRDIAPDLNYIVVAVGDDMEGISLAIRIMDAIRRTDRNFHNIRIFVKNYDSSRLELMKSIIDSCNNTEERIVLFGCIDQIYNYRMIIDNYIEKKARKYMIAYNLLHADDMERSRILRSLDSRSGWHHDPVADRRNKLTARHDDKGNPLEVVDNIRKLRRQESQDFANAFHEFTKIAILDLVFPDWRKSLPSRLFSSTEVYGKTWLMADFVNNPMASPKSTTYNSLNPSEQIIMDNLAKLEHIRWNAAHEAMGYVCSDMNYPIGTTCSEKLAAHKCIVSWEQLDAVSDACSDEDHHEDYKVYDYGVVNTSILLNCREYEDYVNNMFDAY